MSTLADDFELLGDKLSGLEKARAERDERKAALTEAEREVSRREVEFANIRARVFKEHPGLTAGLMAADVPGLVIPTAGEVDDGVYEGLHSRNCPTHLHGHGLQCHSACPTCHGAELG